MTRWRTALVVLIGCVWACGATERAQDGVARVDTVGGTLFVESPPSPSDPARLRTRIGTPGLGPEDGPAVFGRISSVALGRDGTVYVADSRADEVRVFSGDGRHVRTFGGPGEGPGEFGDLYSLGWLADTLAVMDPGNARISLHAADGTYVGQRPWLAYSGPRSVIRLFSLPPGDLYTPYPYFDRENPRHVFLRFRPGRLEPDTLSLPAEEGGSAGSLCALPDGGISFFANPFAPRRIVVPAPAGRLVSGWTNDGRAVSWNAAGDSVEVVSVADRTEPLPDESWDSLTAEFSSYRSERPGSECEPDALVRPPALPRSSGIFFTSEGTLVVERPLASGGRFDFFGPAGVLEQRVDLPARDPGVAPVFEGRRILVVEKDSLDVQSVALYER